MKAFVVLLITSVLTGCSTQRVATPKESIDDFNVQSVNRLGTITSTNDSVFIGQNIKLRGDFLCWEDARSMEPMRLPVANVKMVQFLKRSRGAQYGAAIGASTALIGLTSAYVIVRRRQRDQYFCGNKQGVYLSTNDGATWLPRNRGIGVTIVSLVISGSDMLAGTNGYGVYLSTNGGTTWVVRNTGLTNASVWALTHSGSSLFAGTIGGGVFLSTNNGSNWTAASTGLTNLNVLAMAISGSHILTGTQGGGVFLSTDNGSNGTAANAGLTTGLIHSFLISGTDIFVGAGYAGVWRRPLSELITDVKPDDQSPVSFELYPNSPNPFNPSTVIRYELSTTGMVRLTVYNLLGEEVRTLVAGAQAAGLKSVAWDGKSNVGQEVSSGIYLYRLEAGNLVKSRKMLLVK